MSQYVETPTRTFQATAAVAENLRVSYLSTGKIAVSGAGERGCGTTDAPALAADDYVAVRIWSAQGTRKMVASEAIAAGADVYAAASGKIAATGTVKLGQAKEAATANNDVIEVLPLGSGAPSGVQHVRTRFTIAQINAGATLLPAIPGFKYRMVEASAISVGGAAGAVTTVDILATQSTSSVKLVAFAQASLTQNTQLKSGESGATILAGGVSYVANDVNTAVTVGKTGSDVTTATHIDVLMSYVVES